MNSGDAVIASIATPPTRQQVDSRLLSHAGALRLAPRHPIDDVRPEALEGKKIAVVAGTAHEAYLKALFTEADLNPYPIRTPRCASTGATSICCSATAFRSPSGSTAPIPATVANSAAGPTPRAAISARASASRSARQRRAAAGLQLGAVPAVEEGRFTDLWLRYIPGQPVLNRTFDVGALDS